MKLRLTETQLRQIVDKASDRILNEGMFENDEPESDLWELDYIDQLNSQNADNGSDFEEEDPTMGGDENNVFEKYTRVSPKMKRFNEAIEQEALLEFITKKWNSPANRMLNEGTDYMGNEEYPLPEELKDEEKKNYKPFFPQKVDNLPDDLFGNGGNSETEEDHSNDPDWPDEETLKHANGYDWD